MTEIKPFSGIRFNRKKVNIADVITQPYDKITTEMQDGYYKKSGYNIVRMILGKSFPDDTGNNNKYTRARDALQKFYSDGILIQDKEPSIYPYYQEYTFNTQKSVRRGFCCLLRLKEFSKDTVLPHEKTLSKPKEDRLNLLKATKINFGQIFMLYPDQKNKISKLIDENIGRKSPEIEVSEEYEKGVMHKMWRINNRDLIHEIEDSMKDKVLLIADGHHRYETALNYSKENPAVSYRMVTLVSMNDPGLLILPTHRAIYGVDVKDLLHKAEKFFEIKECSSEGVYPPPIAEDKPRRYLFRDMQSEEHTFGLYLNKRFYILRFRDISIMDKFVDKERSSIYRNLDVVILHSIIIEHILGISKEKVAKKENIDYLREASDGIEGVDERKYSAVFFMNAPRMEQVRSLAQMGEAMPQKSTDFYPKLITGLVMNKLG